MPARIGVELRWEPEPGRWDSEAGVISDASEHGVAVVTRRRLEPGRTVWVMRPGAPSLKAVVRNVRAQNGAWMLGLRLIFHERRRIDRYPFEAGGVLRWAGAFGVTERLQVDVRNFTDWGAQLAAERAAPVGQFVRLSGEEIECEGSVRYYVPSGDEHLIGLHFVGKPTQRFAAADAADS